MKIQVKGINLEITPSLRLYIEKKTDTLARLVKRLDAKDAVELWLEVERTTRHHRKGLVFQAEAHLRLPGRVLRATETAADVRAAIDTVKDKLHAEIEKYKTRMMRREKEK